MRKRYSRSYTVLSFLTMFSYREQPSAALFFFNQSHASNAWLWLKKITLRIENTQSDLKFSRNYFLISPLAAAVR